MNKVSGVKISVKIAKFIDYCYLNNYVKNTLNNYDNKILTEQNNWRIFSNCFYDENKNILNFICSIKKIKSYSTDTILLSIHIFEKICIQYAHLVDNYTCLFGMVYICVNNLVSCVDKHIPFSFAEEFFKLNKKQVRYMSLLIEKFINETNEIYFSDEDKTKIMKSILYD